MRARALLGVLLLATLTTAARSQEPLAERVRTAIERGVRFLTAEERGQGRWLEHPGRPGGVTALALLALFNAGMPPDDPLFQRGLRQLRTYPLRDTYVVGLQAMVYAQAGAEEDRLRIQQCVDWLVDARVMAGDRLLGWGYGKGGGQRDNSNTQYALLGLHEGHVAGARIDPRVWESIRDYYITTQNNDGGWGYHTGGGSTATMTYAGLCGLIIAGMDASSGREIIQRSGQVAGCGDYKENEAVARALGLVGRTFPRSDQMSSNALYYWLYGVERAGRLSGQRFFGGHDWYRAGCEYLVRSQQQDGSWPAEHAYSRAVTTSFALLFLSKGRTPILISKLAHGPGEDWNNDRNDARQLVEFTSRELFKRTPLGWQVFDVRRARAGHQGAVGLLLADLLQTPILYFNGHESPEFTGVEIEGDAPLLRQYVENGGFIFAEACCGGERGRRFDDGFRDLMKKLFPDTPLRRLEPDHPIWRASGKFVVAPDAENNFELWGIEMGCKTVVVYSPRGHLCCWWESNRYKDGVGRQAFQLGANIIAYATGMEPPRSRQFELEPVDGGGDSKVPRGYLKVAQLRHNGDWQPAPRAMFNLMKSVDTLGIDVDRTTEGLRPANVNFPDYRFLYMHGRNQFSLSKEEVKGLRFNLETGGLLFADACCGSREYDRAFRRMVDELWPGRKLERIPITDDLFGKELTGEALTKVRCRREGPDGRPEAEFRLVEPLLEGVKINGRWAVIYSKYDIGCALEKHKSSDCLGHDHASAVKVGTAVVLYALRR